MGFNVVCISRTLAAGGEVIGQAVAQRLGYRYVDEEIVTKAAQKAQVDPHIVAAAEHKRPLLQRLLDALASAQGLADPMATASGLPLEFFYQPAPLQPRATPDDLRALIRATIIEVASAGDAVIVAHAASMALAGHESVLRVLVTASPETRARRMAAGEGISESDAGVAVAASDRERRDYFRQFYKLKEEQPTRYDIVLNTDVLTPEQTVSLIVAAVQG